MEVLRCVYIWVGLGIWMGKRDWVFDGFLMLEPTAL